MTDEKELAEESKLLQCQKIIEACQGLKGNTHWKTILTYVIEPHLREIENRLQYAKDHVDILRYQGEWGAVKKYANLDALMRFYDKEIDRIKNNAKIKETEN